jgi:hypothetical protein
MCQKNDSFKYMSWNPESSYNSLYALPPELKQIETRRVLKACISSVPRWSSLKKQVKCSRISDCWSTAKRMALPASRPS